MKTLQRRLMFGLSMIAFVSFAGCGDDSNPGNPDAYQHSSNSCSDQFVTDANDLAAQLINSISECSQLDSLLNNFQSKYAGVQCQAINLSSGSDENYDVDAEVNSAKNKIDTACASGTQPNSPSVGFPVAVVSPTPVESVELCSSTIATDSQLVDQMGAGNIDCAQANQIDNDFKNADSTSGCGYMASDGIEHFVSVLDEQVQVDAKISQYCSQPQQSTPAPQSPPAPGPASSPAINPARLVLASPNMSVAQDDTAFYFRINDADKFNQLFGSERFIQGGDLASSASSTTSADRCEVLNMPSWKASVKAGDLFEFNYIPPFDESVDGIWEAQISKFDDSTSSLGSLFCSQSPSAHKKSWTINDLQNAFGSVVSFYTESRPAPAQKH